MPPPVNVFPVTRLSRTCDPLEPLEPGDNRLVDLKEARGGSFISRLVREVRDANVDQHQTFFVSGHIGAGKTTELKAFQDKIEKGESKHFVVFISAGEQLDLNDLEFPDLLVLICGACMKRFHEGRIYDWVDKASTGLKSLWDDLKSILFADVTPTSANVDVPFASFALEIRNRPSARAKLRDAIEARASSLIGAVNQFFDEANARLGEQGYAGLIIIVDDLEKMALRAAPDNRTTHERLFIDRTPQMRALRAHIIYTLPVSMCYRPTTAGLQNVLAERIRSTHMLRLREDVNAEIASDAFGMAAMREIIEKRAKHAKVRFEEVFDREETCRRLCEMSGGDPRQLLMLLRTALHETDDLPVTRQHLDAAVRGFANSLLRQMPDEFWPLLARFDKPRGDMPKDAAHQQMLLFLHLFEYENGGSPWYEVNPILKTLDRYQRELTRITQAEENEAKARKPLGFSPSGEGTHRKAAGEAAAANVRGSGRREPRRKGRG